VSCPPLHAFVFRFHWWGVGWQEFIVLSEIWGSGRAEIHTKNDTNVVNTPQPLDNYDIWRCGCIRGVDSLQFEPMHVTMSQKPEVKSRFCCCLSSFSMAYVWGVRGCAMFAVVPRFTLTTAKSKIINGRYRQIGVSKRALSHLRRRVRRSVGSTPKAPGVSQLSRSSRPCCRKCSSACNNTMFSLSIWFWSNWNVSMSGIKGSYRRAKINGLGLFVR
jgi:hypothetical protein